MCTLADFHSSFPLDQWNHSICLFRILSLWLCIYLDYHCFYCNTLIRTVTVSHSLFDETEKTYFKLQSISMCQFTRIPEYPNLYVSVCTTNPAQWQWHCSSSVEILTWLTKASVALRYIIFQGYQGQREQGGYFFFSLKIKSRCLLFSEWLNKNITDFRLTPNAARSDAGSMWAGLSVWWRVETVLLWHDRCNITFVYPTATNGSSQSDGWRMKQPRLQYGWRLNQV